jgi:hypothetical protein
MNTTAPTTPNKKLEERFEFVLYVNKHIICQRYFNIRDFNEESTRSLEIKELMDRIAGMHNGTHGNMGIIPEHLKKQSIAYLWKTYNPNYVQREETYRNIFEKERTFSFEIKIDKNVVAQSVFSGNYFPSKAICPEEAKYQIDIKEIIPDIIALIKDYLGEKNYTTNYADVVL